MNEAQTRVEHIDPALELQSHSSRPPYGESPLWVIFPHTKWGRALEVRSLLEQWAGEKGIFVATHEDESFVVALTIPFGEERRHVVRSIVARLSEIATRLADLNAVPPSELPT